MHDVSSPESLLIDDGGLMQWPVLVDELVPCCGDVLFRDWYGMMVGPFGDCLDHFGCVQLLGAVVR